MFCKQGRVLVGHGQAGGQEWQQFLFPKETPKRQPPEAMMCQRVNSSTRPRPVHWLLACSRGSLGTAQPPGSPLGARRSTLQGAPHRRTPRGRHRDRSDTSWWQRTGRSILFYALCVLKGENVGSPTSALPLLGIYLSLCGHGFLNYLLCPRNLFLRYAIDLIWKQEKSSY